MRELTKIESALDIINRIQPPPFIQVGETRKSWKLTDTGSSILARVNDLRVLEVDYPTDHQILTASVEDLAIIITGRLGSKNNNRDRHLQILVPEGRGKYIICVNGRQEYKFEGLGVSSGGKGDRLVQFFGVADSRGACSAVQVVDWHVWSEVHLVTGTPSGYTNVITRHAPALI